MSLEQQIESSRELRVQQRKELAELFGFETRNKYEIHDQSDAVIGFAAEQGKGLLAHFSRYFLGHWRRFDIHVFDKNRKPLWRFTHPFRFFFQRLEVDTESGVRIGALQQRFSILSKKFDFEDASGNVLFSMHAPFWRIWTFPIQKNGNQVGVIEKKWGGFIKEIVTDADNFRVSFGNPGLKLNDRILILAAAIFIDLQYFEKRAKD